MLGIQLVLVAENAIIGDGNNVLMYSCVFAISVTVAQDSV